MASGDKWFVYILRCVDGSLYTGITKDVMRAELPRKVNGSAQYAIDVQVPGMVYGAVLRSPVEGAIAEDELRRGRHGRRP